jgi:ABC-type Fe3+/spermidine/putrescine transport system ATPase subunit
MSEAVLELRGVSAGYDGTAVLREVSLSVGPDEGVAILGPSGSGKTTLLYAVAGFIRPRAGEIRIRGRTVAAGSVALPPEERRVGVVFQHYALWPHLSALDTVAYPLRRRGLSTAEAAAGARALLDRLAVGHLADRRPAQLSGGEQQRVGLARALARAPDVFLLDEPTAHLDAALKTALQEALADSGRGAGVATLYATHDVAEALAVADRVALLRDGRIVQVGTPVEVYARPVDHWAAALTGPVSMLDAVLTDGDVGAATLQLGDRRLRVACDGDATGVTRVLVRPDWASLDDGELTGRVASVRYHGTHTDYRVEIGAGSIAVRDAGPPRHVSGDVIGVRIRRVWPLRGEVG